MDVLTWNLSKNEWPTFKHRPKISWLLIMVQASNTLHPIFPHDVYVILLPSQAQAVHLSWYVNLHEKSQWIGFAWLHSLDTTLRKIKFGIVLEMFVRVCMAFFDRQASLLRERQLMAICTLDNRKHFSKSVSSNFSHRKFKHLIISAGVCGLLTASRMMTKINLFWSILAQQTSQNDTEDSAQRNFLQPWNIEWK